MMRDDKRCDGRLRDLERRKPRFFRFCMYSHGLAFQSIPLNLCGWDVVTCCCWWKFKAMMFFRRDVVGKWRTKKRCMHVAETLPYAPATCMSNQSDKPLPAMTTRNWDDKARVASPSTERREECHLQTTVPSELHLLPILRSHRSDRSNALTTWSTFTNEDRNTHTHEPNKPSHPNHPSRAECAREPDRHPQTTEPGRRKGTGRERMSAINPSSWLPAYRARVRALPLFTRAVVAAIVAFWVVGVPKGLWDVRAWGALVPDEVGFASCKSFSCLWGEVWLWRRSGGGRWERGVGSRGERR